MAYVEKSPFLICRNCINWGHPWFLKRKTRECSKVKDDQGKLYTPYHAACRYFSPKQSLPVDLQRLRLFVQALEQSEVDYLNWSLSQRELLLEVKDSKNQELTLGDYVQFRHGINSFYGTVEGVDHDNPDAVVINTPAFPDATITLISSTVKKLTREELKVVVQKTLPPQTKESLDWQIKAMENEIVTLRARSMDTLDLDERDHLAFLEVELREKKSLLRYYSSFF